MGHFHSLLCPVHTHTHTIHLDRCENKPSTQQCFLCLAALACIFLLAVRRPPSIDDFFFFLSSSIVYVYTKYVITQCCIYIYDEKSKRFHPFQSIQVRKDQRVFDAYKWRDVNNIRPTHLLYIILNLNLSFLSYF